jgi:hypothetical protein
MAQSGECPVGSRVRVAAGDGIVRWTGTNPDFAAGKWIGIELYVSTSATLMSLILLLMFSLKSQLRAEWEE